MSLLQKCSHRLDLLYVCFQFRDRFFLCKRHDLNDKSTCLTHGIILIHQNTKTYSGRNLFTCCEIISQVFCDLTCLKCHLSHIWFFESHVLDDLKETVSNSTANIQFALGICRDDNIRFNDISLDTAFGICCNRDSLKQSVTLDLKCQDILIALHHHAHHRTCCQKTSKCCCCNRAGVVILSCCLYCLCCHCCKRTDLAVCRNCSYYIITHEFTSFLILLCLFLLR